MRPAGEVTRREALELAELEYPPPRPARDGAGWYVVSRGADGGYHLRAVYGRHADAAGWIADRRARLVRRILAGECSSLYRTAGGRLELL